jgi:hypothetical protein
VFCSHRPQCLFHGSSPANIHNHAGRSDSLGTIVLLAKSLEGRSRQFFEPLDSVQECLEPLF